MFLPSTTIAVEQCLQVMRTNLPRTFASETEYCAEQELQTIIKPTSSLSLLYGGREPDQPQLWLPHDVEPVVTTSEKRRRCQQTGHFMAFYREIGVDRRRVPHLSVRTFAPSNTHRFRLAAGPATPFRLNRPGTHSLRFVPRDPCEVCVGRTSPSPDCGDELSSLPGFGRSLRTTCRTQPTRRAAGMLTGIIAKVTGSMSITVGRR